MSAFNGSGTFVISGTGLPYVTATTISSTVANQLNTDLATGLSTTVTKDGQTTPTANLPMGTFKHTGAGNATASGQYLVYGQPQVNIFGAASAVFGTTGTGLIGNAFTQTDSITGAGTVATAYGSVFGAFTLATAANAITVTNAYGVYFKDPVAGAHATLTSKYALGADSISATTINGSTLAVPTQQRLTSGSSATYTAPAGVRQLRIFFCGGGGGGGGSSTSALVAGSDGGTTTFNSVNAVGGKGSPGGVGGYATTAGTGTAQQRMPGNSGLHATGQGLSAGDASGGNGGPGPFGGSPGPSGGGGAVGVSAPANSGSGGGGSSNDGATPFHVGGGGQAGENVWLIINSPSATYTYTIGAGGAGGISTNNGGAGGSGIIIVDEIY